MKYAHPYCRLLGLGMMLGLFLASSAAFGGGLTPDQEQALRAIARGQTFTWPEMTPGQASELCDKAERYLEHYEKYNLPQGYNADLWWVDPARSRAHMYDGIGDSATWTGHYLAALVIKCSVTGDASLRDRILWTLEKFDLLTRVSGRVGYVARYAGDADDPAYREYYRVYGRGESPERPGLGKKAFWGVAPYEKMVWLGDSSRDTYDGTAMGLAATLAYAKDAEIRRRATQLVECIGDRLIADEWRIVDGQGNSTQATSTFKLEWMRLILSANPKKYKALRSDYKAAMSAYTGDGPRIRAKDADEYFPANLDFIRLFVLNELEEKAAWSKKFKSALTHAYLDKASDHLNGYFAAIYILGTGDKKNANARATLQGTLLDFPAPPKFLRVVDVRNDPSIEQKNEKYTLYALLPRERTVSDFIWQRPPCLSHAGDERAIEFPGIDLFLPYWMGRLSGAIPAPPGKS